MSIFSNIKLYFNKTSISILVLLLFFLLYPKPLEIMGVQVVNDFIKTRVLSLGILFLVLRGIIDAYYSPRLAVLFLIVLILSPTLTFGQLVLVILLGLIILRVLKKI